MLQCKISFALAAQISGLSGLGGGFFRGQGADGQGMDPLRQFRSQRVIDQALACHPAQPLEPVRYDGDIEMGFSAGMVRPRMAGMPVGMDFAADGSAAVVLTYMDVLLFPRQPGESWTDALTRAPQRLHPALKLEPRDYVYFLAQPNEVPLLNRLFDPHRAPDRPATGRQRSPRR